MVESKEIPIYNSWRDEHYIKLNLGEEICPKCKGTGSSHHKYHVCSFCYGRGKVDWIKRIRGI